MPWRGPAHPDDFPTLGWAVLDHMAEHLPSPADPAEPFILTDEQALIVLRWFELDPMTGEFVHRRGRLEMAKGWGKSPLLAAIAIEEFAGPVCFDGWDDHGEPKAARRYWPVVEIAAVSEDQTDNTYSALYQMLTANEARASKSLGIDLGRTRLLLAGGAPGMLRPVTAESASREGARLTFAVLDETHLWNRQNGGRKLAATLRRNAAKMDGRTFETTNAPVLGEGSVAEESGNDASLGVLHVARRPSTEPTLDTPDAEMRELLRETYGDAHWAPLDRILAEIADPATSFDDALRYYFNIRTAGVARAVDPRMWDGLAKPRIVPSGTPIGLGFDGSTYHDATVLRGCTADGYSWVIGRWSRPEGVESWQVPRAEVTQAVADAFSRYRVGRMLADPPGWITEIGTWVERYGEEVVLGFDTAQPRRMAPAIDRWRTAVRARSHTHDGDEFCSTQIKDTRLRKVRVSDPDDDRTLYMFEKGPAGTDAAIADVLAYEAAMTMPEVPAAPKVEFVVL